MYRRILFVGLGGSGGKTLRFIKRDLRAWLDQAGWTQKHIPRGFQFLHIDTPTVEDGREVTSADMLEDDEYVGLIGPGVTLTSVVQGLDSNPDFTELAGWRVNPSEVDVSLQDGAGQYRAVGRTVALSQIATVKRGLANAIQKINSKLAVEDNTTLWGLTGQEVKGGQQEPFVFVISSLAGGTGAGLLIDVCDVLRILEPTWGAKSFGILYTPEVFGDLGAASTGGVQPNSLAAINEVLNGYYLKAVAAGGAGTVGANFVSTRQSRLLASAGIAGSVAKSGPEYPFLVGIQNTSNMQYESGVQVFAAIGGVLSAVCRDVLVQSQFQKKTFENWNMQATNNVVATDILINIGSQVERGVAAFQSLGCAKVSVGSRYLRQYAAQRLAKDAYRWITRYHTEEIEARQIQEDQGINDPREISRRIALKHKDWFLKVAQLDERGIDRNDVTAFLTPVEAEAEKVKSFEEAKRLADRGKANSNGWLEWIADAVRNVASSYDDMMMPLVDRQVALWVAEHPERLITSVEKSIARFGLQVTVELLKLTIEEFLDPANGVIAEIMGPTEHGEYVRLSQETQWQSAAEAELGQSKGRYTIQSNERVGLAIWNSLNYAVMSVDVKIRERAGLLLTEYCNAVLTPIQQALTNALVKVTSPDEEEKTTNWPLWNYGSDTPHSDLLPTKNELTLIEPEEFSDVFVQKLAESMDGDMNFREDHRATARADVISGQFIRELAADRNVITADAGIRVRATWQPSFNLIKSRGTVRAQSEINVEFAFAPEDLRKRAELWLDREGTALQKFLSAGLAAYTKSEGPFKNTNPQEMATRQSRLVSKLRAAIELSSPLVETNVQLAQVIGSTQGDDKFFSGIPFNEHPLKAEVQALVRPHIENSTQSLSDVIVSGEAEAIEVVSFLNGPQQPIIFKSLLSPIAAKWAEFRFNPPERISFWTLRRARLAGEAIPAPQAHIVAMIRGWFTAQMLGLIDIPRGEGRPIRIAQGWLPYEASSFPEMLLTYGSGSDYHEETLFSVLESLGLALVESCQLSNTSPLNAYIALRNFGVTDPENMTSGILQYKRANSLLRDWITTGKLSTPIKQDEAELRSGLSSTLIPSLSGKSTEDERRDAVLDHVTALHDFLVRESEAFFTSARRNRNELKNSIFWPSLQTTAENSSLMIRAVLSLRDGIANKN